VDTTPKKMPSIREDKDHIKPGMILNKSPSQIGTQEVEYGSNTERVINLENKHGSY
jgi:hypothetical protein